MKNMMREFKEFALKGNVLDLAVGVVIGGAFGKIVSSLVDNIIMPIIGVISGGIDFTDLSFMFGKASIKYGMFLQSVIDFLIIAFSIFIFVKVSNKLIKRKNEVEEEVAELEVNATEEYLREIRDLLKDKNI